jgi:hypothetical protein
MGEDGTGRTGRQVHEIVNFRLTITASPTANSRKANMQSIFAFRSETKRDRSELGAGLCEILKQKIHIAVHEQLVIQEETRSYNDYNRESTKPMNSSKKKNKDYASKQEQR